MKLIRVEETGVQFQYSLPTLQAEASIIQDETGKNKTLTEEDIRKQERINKMLIAQGRTPEKVKGELANHIEPNFVYLSISGYEYIKMNLEEFWWFVNIINALANIDADELGFYGINLFVCKEVISANRSYELVQFEYTVLSGDTYSGNISGMCDALMALDFNETSYKNFFSNIKLLG